MVKLNLNTNGFTPPADTVSGASGTVTGTERKKLQDILDAAKQMATGALDGLMSAAHYALLAGATALNTANTLVRRDAAGNFAAGTITGALNGNATSATSATTAGSATSAGSCTGNAATATALQGGGADRVKLDGIAAGATVNPMTQMDVTLSDGAGLSGGVWNNCGSLALGAGTWLVQMQVGVRDTGASNVGFNGRIRQSSNNGIVGGAEVSTGDVGTVGEMVVHAIMAGGQTAFAEVYADIIGAGQPRVITNTVLTGTRMSYMKAVRVL